MFGAEQQQIVQQCSTFGSYINQYGYNYPYEYIYPYYMQPGLMPGTNQGPEFPSTYQGPEFPSTYQGPECPSTNQGPECPSTNQGPECPTTNQGPECPSTNQGPGELQRNLQDRKVGLQKEIEKLEEKLTNLKEITNTQMMFRHWSGFEIDPCSSDTELNVTFPIFRNGKDHGKYTISFGKLETNWFVLQYDLPPCMRMIPQRIRDAKINNNIKLCRMIRQLQYEVELFNLREQQFQEAKALASRSLGIYPSMNTLSVMLQMFVFDSLGSDMYVASAYLTYRTTKFLPEQPLFKFIGGTQESQKEFIKQLSCLETKPLKDALIEAFALNLPETTVSSIGNGSNSIGSNFLKESDDRKDLKYFITSRLKPLIQSKLKSDFAKTSVRGAGRGRGPGRGRERKEKLS